VPTIVSQLNDAAQRSYWAQKLGGDFAPLHLHPTQLYESFAMLIVFGFLLLLHKRKRFSGQMILTYALLYSIIRFLIEFVRDDPRGDLFGLTTLTGLSTSQIISVVVGAGALILLIMRWRRASGLTKATRAVEPTPA
jgi:phosphatidylglycerol:prolipoprotein diacylglycerol transferase